MGFEPRVTIVIPCFNCAGFIQDAVRSALAQTYPNTEVYVIDDGSTDSSVEEVKAFGDRVTLYTQPHSGGAAARNKGIELARGEYIQFLDADDELYPTKIEKHIDFIRSHRGLPGSAVTFCDYTVIPENGGPEQIVRPATAPHDSIAFVLSHQISVGAPLYPRQLLMAVEGFRVGLPCSQEFDLNLRLAVEGVKWVHVPEVLYAVHKRSGSVSSSYLNVLDQRQNIMENALRLLKEKGNLSESAILLFSGEMARAGRHYLELGERNKARLSFDLSRSWHPEGWKLAYSLTGRVLAKLIGPIAACQISIMKRRFMGVSNSHK